MEAYLQGAFQFFEKLDTVTSVDNMSQYLQEKMMTGADVVEVYAEGISEDDIQNINKNMNGFFGTVSTFTIMGKRSSGKMRVKLQMKPSENLYVWNMLMNPGAVDQSKTPTDREVALYNKVVEIISSQIQSGMSDYEKEQAIHDYLVLNCAYDTSFRVENSTVESDVNKLYGILMNQKSVCNGYAEAMYILLNACDVECKIIVGTADGMPHAWNIVKLDGEWYQVDTTWDDPTPDRAGSVQHQFMNLTDEAMLKTHQWEEKNYPKCSKDAYNYFVHNNKVCNSYEAFQTIVGSEIQMKHKDIEVFVPKFDEKEYDLSFVIDRYPEVSKGSYSTSEVANGTVVLITVEY